VDKLEEKLSETNLSKTKSETGLNSSSSHNSLRPKKRSSTKKIKDVKQLSTDVPRSNTSNLDNSYVNHHNHSLFDLTPQQWDFINNYPTKYGDSKEHVKTNYITEIYDRATNRFIPTTCCY
jgi:hypothetical protein